MPGHLIWEKGGKEQLFHVHLSNVKDLWAGSEFSHIHEKIWCEKERQVLGQGAGGGPGEWEIFILILVWTISDWCGHKDYCCRREGRRKGGEQRSSEG